MNAILKAEHKKFAHLEMIFKNAFVNAD